MSNIHARGNVQRAQIRAVITRADGRVEDLGVIASYKKSVLVRFIHWLRRKIIG